MLHGAAAAASLSSVVPHTHCHHRHRHRHHHYHIRMTLGTGAARININKRYDMYCQKHDSAASAAKCIFCVIVSSSSRARVVGGCGAQGGQGAATSAGKHNIAAKADTNRAALAN